MKIALCLSGGGFRAMLFHLGVVRFLAAAGLLRDVRRIDSVSGGSVLAAHLALNWDAYCHDATAASDELVAFAQRDVRGRIIRRRLLACLCLVPIVLRLFGPLLPKRLETRLRCRFTDFLRREYVKLYRGNKLKALYASSQGERPDIYIHTTSLTSGKPCAFVARPARDGNMRAVAEAFFVNGMEEASRRFRADQVDLALVVASSSAFPPLFQPVQVSADDFARGPEGCAATQALTDGGVFDNLGIHRVFAEAASYDWVIVSDAGGGFGEDETRTFRGIFSRNIRVSDLLMYRNGVLQRQVCGVSPAITIPSDSSPGPPILSVRMGPDPPDDDPLLDPQQQEAIRNFRTDLNAFSDVEVEHLLHHGWALAAAMVRRAGFRDPAPDAPALRPADIEVLRRGRERSTGLWSVRDPFGMLYAVVLCLWIGVAGWIVARAVNRPELMLTEDTWPAATQAWLNEPSDLAASGVTRQARPVLLSVDDEESGLFVVQLLPDHKQAGVIRVLDIGPDLKDLEAVSFDPCAGSGVAVTSHRRFDQPASSWLIEFELPADLEQKPEAPLITRKSLNGVLQKALNEVHINVNKELWRKELGDDERKIDETDNGTKVYYPYALEVEGAAYRNGTVTLGLRWPLTEKGEAILLEYDLSSERTKTRLVRLDGNGISALAWVGDWLYIAANPPGKERKDVKDGYPFNESTVYRYKPGHGRPMKLRGLTSAMNDAKLEGIAIVENEIIGAFDGPGHVIRSIGQVHNDDRLSLSWWNQAINRLRGRLPNRCPS